MQEGCKGEEEESDRKMQKERSHFTPSSIIFTVGVADFGFCTFEHCGVGGKGAGEVPGECVCLCVCVTVCARGVCTFKINWSDERGALGLAVAPIIHLVMSPASVCVGERVCVPVGVWNFSLLSDPAVRPLRSKEGEYGLSGGRMMLLSSPLPQTFLGECVHARRCTYERQTPPMFIGNLKPLRTWQEERRGKEEKEWRRHLGAQSARGIITFPFHLMKHIGWISFTLSMGPRGEGSLRSGLGSYSGLQTAG